MNESKVKDQRSYGPGFGFALDQCDIFVSFLQVGNKLIRRKGCALLGGDTHNYVLEPHNLAFTSLRAMQTHA